MIYYRSAQNTDLTAGQVDSNFRTLAEGLAAAQSAGATIIDIVIEGSSMTFVMSDTSTLGPFELPAGMPDAPNDGASYVRKNQNWSVTTGGGLAHAASDGSLYGSKNGEWTAFTPGITDAPTDGSTYGRKNNAWVIASSTAGGMRHRGDWTSSLVIAKYDLVERNGETWMAREGYGTGAPAPSTTTLNWWRMIGFPTNDLYEMTSHMLYHRFATAERSDTVTFWEIFNDLESRIHSLENSPA